MKLIQSVNEQFSAEVEKWKEAVKAKYPEIASKLKFRPKDQGKHLSAEIDGEDRSYGVLDLETGKWEVLEESIVETVAAGKETKIDLSLISKLASDEEHQVSKDDVQGVVDAAHAEEDEEVDTVTFGLETEDGEIVKVYVNVKDADAFEEAMANLLGSEDSIEDALEKLAEEFDIVSVVWPEKDDGDEDDDGGLADIDDGDIELDPEPDTQPATKTKIAPTTEGDEAMSIGQNFLKRVLGEAKEDDDDEEVEVAKAGELPALSAEGEKVLSHFKFPRFLSRLLVNTVLLTGFPPGIYLRNPATVRKSILKATNEINKNSRAKMWLKQFNAALADSPLKQEEFEDLSDDMLAEDAKDPRKGLVFMRADSMSSKLYDLIVALGLPEANMNYSRAALKTYFRNTGLLIAKRSKVKTRFNMLHKMLAGGEKSGSHDFDEPEDETVEEALRDVREARAGANYHSIFVKGKDGKWMHHFDADDDIDAKDEMRSLRNSGEKPIKLVVPKADATWTKGGKYINDYVEKRLADKAEKVQEELDEEPSKFSRLSEMAKKKGRPANDDDSVDDEGEFDDDGPAIADKVDDETERKKSSKAASTKEVTATDLGGWSISQVGSTVTLKADNFIVKCNSEQAEKIVAALGNNSATTVRGQGGKKFNFVPHKTGNKYVFVVKQVNSDKYPDGVLLSSKSIDAILDYEFK